MRKPLLALLAAVALLLLWRLVPRDADTAARLTRGAGFDLVAACNGAAAAENAPERFALADVGPAQDAPDGQGRVAALASALEARHGGLACRWDGIAPPKLNRAQ